MSGELYDLAKKYRAIKFYDDHRYGPIYERIFDPIRSSVTRVMEIGIDDGNSARVWLEYFPNAILYAVDVNEDCAHRITNPRFWPIITDQSNATLWDKVPGDLDLVIDDGSHLPWDQITTFHNGFEKVKPHGFWFIEDVHTSFWKQYRPEGLGVFNEAIVRMIEMQTFGSGYGDFYRARKEMGDFMSTMGKMTYGMQVYKSLVVFEKSADRSAQEVSNGRS